MINKKIITIAIIVLLAIAGAFKLNYKHSYCYLIDTKSLIALGSVSQTQVGTSILIGIRGLLNDDFLFKKTSKNTFNLVTVNEYIIYDTVTNTITARERSSGLIATYEIICE